MFYDRKIKYFDYRKKGERIGNAGFVKIQARGDVCSLLIQIAGLHLTDTFSRQVYLVAGGREVPLCMIDLQAGKGNRQLQLPLDNLNSSVSDKLAYADLEGIRIPVASGVELYCEILEGAEEDRSPKRPTSAVTYVSHEGAEKAEINASDGEPEQLTGDTGHEGIAQVTTNTGHEGMKQPTDNTVPQQTERVTYNVSMEPLEHTRENKATLDMESVEEENKEISTVVNMGVKDSGQERDVIPGRRESGRVRENKTLKMQEDKWQQLSAIYPHIRPFRDTRDYLRLNPEDFVIFNSRFYKLVHNSFLLHGYYNYQHLILARIEQRGVPCYYIGVPGNFYDREKQVALMFGFESFECQTEPADTGDFGYYMIRTEL